MKNGLSGIEIGWQNLVNKKSSNVDLVITVLFSVI